jgi:hypothetical protein
MTKRIVRRVEYLKTVSSFKCLILSKINFSRLVSLDNESRSLLDNLGELNIERDVRLTKGDIAHSPPAKQKSIDNSTRFERRRATNQLKILI